MTNLEYKPNANFVFSSKLILVAQPNPISGTLYPVLDIAYGVQIIHAIINTTWTLQPTPLQLHITVDGVQWVHNQPNPVSTTQYFANVNPVAEAENDQAFNAASGTLAYVKGALYEGRHVVVEMEVTGGTVQEIECCVYYADRIAV